MSIYLGVVFRKQVVQEYVLGYYDPEATSAYNENLSDISMLKDPRSKDASQRYIRSYCYSPYWEWKYNY